MANNLGLEDLNMLWNITAYNDCVDKQSTARNITNKWLCHRSHLSTLPSDRTLYTQDSMCQNSYSVQSTRFMVTFSGVNVLVVASNGLFVYESLQVAVMGGFSLQVATFFGVLSQILSILVPQHPLFFMDLHTSHKYNKVDSYT